MNPRDRLIVALDFDSRSKAMKMVNLLKRDVKFFKVGLELFLNCGAGIIDEIMETGREVFLDLKLHDIPNTVMRAAIAATRLETFMFNVHTLGGYEMMRSTARSVESEADRLGIRRPKILGVTILTSMDDKALKGIGLEAKVSEEVLRLACLAREAGLDGVVASPREAKMIRQKLGKNFLIVTPGIRPAQGVRHDQKRIAAPGVAIKSGANFIVVGRPITEAKDPVKAAQDILKEMKI